MRSDGDNQVRSFTEWDQLTEVIVGRLDGGVFPSWQPAMVDTLPHETWDAALREQGGRPFPAAQLQAAQSELNTLCEILAGEGVRVRRPELAPHHKPFATPNWSVRGGLYAGMPRDGLMVVGDTIIEAPMSWRCRYFEADAYRSLIKDYFRHGARWLAGPRPQLTDELYRGCADGTDEAWAVTEFEPVFDAADFLRFGRDIVAQRSHVTNEFGIEWVRRAVGPEFRVHVIEVDDPHAMHIDATLMPLAPGKLLVNPERFVPTELFKGWEILEAPKPALPPSWPMYFCSPWVSMNVLSVNPGTVVVESHELALIEALSEWGFRCLPADFRHVYSFGGSFHCVTLDVARSGANGAYLHVEDRAGA